MYHFEIKFCAFCVYIFCFSANLYAKNTLTLGWSKMPRAIDPRYSIDEGSFTLSQMTHCSLIRHNSKEQAEGYLAKSWNWKSEKELVVFLKKGIKFSDGSLVDSSAVKRTYDSIINHKDKKILSPFSGAFRNLKQVRVESPEKVVFELESHHSFFPDDLVIGILPSHLSDSQQITDYKKIIGCGPYQIVGKSRMQLQLARNENYNLDLLAKTERVNIQIVKDASTMMSKLIKNEIDLVHETLTFGSYNQIEKKHKSLKVDVASIPQTSYLGFNMEHPILQNKMVRQAVGMSIHREEMLKYILDNRAKLAKTFLPPSNFYYREPKNQLKFNLSEAKKLLDKAGYPLDPSTGVRFTLKISTSTSAVSMAFAQTISSNLSKVGIGVKHRSTEWAKFKSDLEKGRAQIWILQSVGIKTPEIYQAMLAKSRMPPNGPNRGRYYNSNLENLFLRVSKSRDKQEIFNIYGEIINLVAEERPYIFLFHNELIYVSDSKVLGVENNKHLGYARMLSKIEKKV